MNVDDVLASATPAEIVSMAEEVLGTDLGSDSYLELLEKLRDISTRSLNANERRWVRTIAEGIVLSLLDDHGLESEADVWMAILENEDADHNV